MPEWEADMQVIIVGEFKARFSEILNQVKKGQEIVISFGKQRKKVAVLIPADRHFVAYQDYGLELFW
jgi:prevent-host-death family protein